jgi:xylan 1,4-beta-xylosidase
MVCDKYKTAECLDNPILLLGNVDIFLKVTWDRKEVQFYYATEQGKWNAVGPVLDGSILSDDYVRDEKNRYRPAFTGAFVGMCCQDLTGNRKHADFKYWRYEEASSG